MLAGLRLRPGAAAAVIGRPVDEFTDRQLPGMGSNSAAVGDLLRPKKALTATTPRDRVTALQDMLIVRIRPAPSHPSTLRSPG